MTERPAHPAEDCRRHALFMTTSSKVPLRTARASVELACFWTQLKKKKNYLRTVQCGQKNNGMRTGHEKEGDKRGKQCSRWDRRGIRRKAYIPKIELPQNDKKRLPCTFRRERMVAHYLTDISLLSTV